MTDSKKKRVYTPEYRREAALLVVDSQRPIAQVAKEIGVGEQLLGRWVQAYKKSLGPQDLSVDERKELSRLRRENAELRIDNEFLGKAAAFFAASRTPSSATR